ncbi:hypothetical protein [Streptomyces colonosanans]|uniref:Uncharacterized protein n=1 Tax=Streptomyces colonosanans TaxID=1428652 RepID=A0A1S2P9F1_9ACTN|nr:hypothetical protein [Streptomyces colonosanans]OIJ90423.1 hypothetical protein BIV24_17895 [Streptomyces colonosanans]
MFASAAAQTAASSSAWRRLARLRAEGLVDRITLPQAGRTRVWFPTPYVVQLASEWREMLCRTTSAGDGSEVQSGLAAGGR